MDRLFILGIVAVIVTVIVAVWYAGHKRRKELIAWGQARGLSFSASKDPAFAREYPTFDCLRRGNNQYAYNMLSGQWQNRAFLGFDYHYATVTVGPKGQPRTQHHHFSAVIIKTGFPLKPLQIRSETFMDKLGEMFGFDDIDFESAEFSRKFSVKAEDRKWAFDVLHPLTMEFLLAAPQFPILFDTKSVITWRDHEFNVQEFSQAAGLITGILDRLPGYLVQQQTQSTPVSV